MALEAGAAVMVTSHLGRPTEGAFKPDDSLAPVAARLSSLLGREVPLVADWVDGVQLQPGQVVLLENCRVNVGEKKNSEALARKLAALCDIFVNDAFGTAHRAEGTTYGIAQFAPIACAGPLLAAEIDAITKALASPKRPLAAIVAGSQGSTKLTILQSLSKNLADNALILDTGPAAAPRRADQLLQAGTIVWNGPVGVFEFAPFENGTRTIAHAIAQSPAFSIAGGGDTLAAIAKYCIEKEVGYISTGGGAFLEVLEGKTLPAFEILEKRAST